MEIRKKIVLAAGVMSVVFSIAIACLFQYINKYEIEKNIQDNVAILSSTYSEMINDFLNQKRIDLKSITGLIEVRDYAVQGNIKENYYDIADDGINRSIKKVLRMFSENEDYIMAVDILNRDGIVLISSNDRNIKKKSSFEIPESFSDLSGTDFVVSSAKNLNSAYGENPYFYVGVPISEAGEYFGYAVMKINMDYFLEISKKSADYNLGFISLLDSDGYCVASGGDYVSSNVNEIMTDDGESVYDKIIEAGYPSEVEGFLKYSMSGRQRNAYFKTISDSDGWIVIMGIDAGVAAGVSASSNIMFSVVLAFCCFINVMFAYYYARRLSLPVDVINEGLSRAVERKEAVRFDENACDGAGETGRLLNVIFDEIEKSREKFEAFARESILCMRNFPGGMLKCSADEYCEIEFVSESFLQLLGCTEDEIGLVYGSKFFETVHPEDLERVKKRMLSIRGSNDFVEFEFRMKKKNGLYIWVRDRSRMLEDENGNRFFYSLITDISQSMASEEAYKKIEERYKRIVDWTEDIVFEWDKSTDALMFSSGVENKLGYLPIRLSANSDMLVPQNIHPDDEMKFVDIIERVFYMIRGCEAEIRFKRIHEDNYLWYKIKVDAILGSNGEISKIMGILMNIDYQKRAEEKVDGERDKLSGFYTESGFELMVREALTKANMSGRCAVLIFDIDDFSRVQRDMGMSFSETILGDISLKLSFIFGNEDIAARIGEDKFAVFINNIRSRSSLVTKINNVMDTLRGSYSGKNGECLITGCVGAAVMESDEGYEELYENAGKALSKARAKGADKYAVYETEAE